LKVQGQKTFQISRRDIEVNTGCIFLLLSLGTAALLHRKPAFANTYREISRAQRHDKRITLYSDVFWRNSFKICGMDSCDRVYGLIASLGNNVINLQINTARN
jgi:hypothetical protein